MPYMSPAATAHIVLVAICLVSSASLVRAQTADSNSTGTTISPGTNGVKQPQGSTGPLSTGSGGAPAASPQGETPPAMQAAPEGSSKSIVAPHSE